MYIITGASRGIGKFLLQHYLGQGEEVIGFYNNTLPDQHNGCYYKVDITHPAEVTAFFAGHKDRLKNIRVINAAGIAYSAFAHKADITKWKEVIDTNLVGLFNVISGVLPFMREENYGRIVNFSSVVALQGVMGTSAYAASKAALSGLSKSLAVENGMKNITINNINLGYFNIGMIEQVPQDKLSQIIEKIPANRLGDPVDILSTVDYMIRTSYLNGSSIDLNGGLF
ncbi:SDR family NAD(P)-dependent oxidoreductase [Hufsiella ginkgonis]|uniref:SDR family NAD(P)-dependent oxidoreductase n=1 Tax=Hufsiella ginkgonis TaxID=2695274 RepID=A0A7K1Y1Y6_9SPHI|nr:SDR family NAD(P)-dependent oxidoreductase [Hufsiella ginkgonis]MXV16696.1 SDR family NAD(P)-dependent oxidoreductase [Hufsiella ginkgonis]